LLGGAAEGDVAGGEMLVIKCVKARRVWETCREVPLDQPFPTTKSPALEKETEYPLLEGEKLTLPPVL
jgi:hypothetical protein